MLIEMTYNLSSLNAHWGTGEAVQYTHSASAARQTGLRDYNAMEKPKPFILTCKHFIRISTVDP